MATEPVTVTDSDVQSLEKKLVEFAEKLPQPEQMYLAAMLAKGIETPDDVTGFIPKQPTGGGGGSPIPLPGPTLPTPTPAEKLKSWMRDWGVKV
jgi:hypothetical protein